MDRRIAMETPIEIDIFIIFFEIDPSVISSTSLVKIFIAGSANTTRKPIIMPKGIIIFIKLKLPKLSPSKKPVFIKPTLTPVKNKQSPVKVAISPTIIFLVCFFVKSFLNNSFNIINSAIIGLIEVAISLDR